MGTSLDTELLHAVETEDLGKVCDLLAQRANPDIPHSEKDTCLMIAIRRRATAIAKELLNSCRKLDAKNKHGETALTLAISALDGEIVSVLLQKGANPLKKDGSGADALKNARRVCSVYHSDPEKSEKAQAIRATIQRALKTTQAGSTSDLRVSRERSSKSTFYQLLDDSEVKVSLSPWPPENSHFALTLSAAAFADGGNNTEKVRVRTATDRVFIEVPLKQVTEDETKIFEISLTGAFESIELEFSTVGEAPYVVEPWNVNE